MQWVRRIFHDGSWFVQHPPLTRPPKSPACGQDRAGPPDRLIVSLPVPVGAACSPPDGSVLDG